MDTAASSRLIAQKPLLLVQVWRGKRWKRNGEATKGVDAMRWYFQDMFAVFFFLPRCRIGTWGMISQISTVFRRASRFHKQNLWLKLCQETLTEMHVNQYKKPQILASCSLCKSAIQWDSDRRFKSCPQENPPRVRHGWTVGLEGFFKKVCCCG